MAVNVFWRHLPAAALPAKDLYGNRDPLAAEAAMAAGEQAIKQLGRLPDAYRRFYATLLCARIAEAAGLRSDEIGCEADDNAE